MADLAHRAAARASELALILAAVGRPQRFAPVHLSPVHLLAIIVLCGPIYGAAMGSFQFAFSERLLLVLFSAIKVPLLLLATAAVCLPGFFVINTVLRLRDDFAEALAAILAGQAALAAALASLAPLTRFVYFSGVNHRWALLCNAAAFAAAALIAQIVIRRRYRPLIERSPRHRVMLVTWFVLYAFVGIQMGWMLRPFVGTPGLAVSFFRDEPFSNAYVAVAKLFDFSSGSMP